MAEGKAIDFKVFGRILKFAKPYPVPFYLTILFTLSKGFSEVYRIFLIADITGELLDDRDVSAIGFNTAIIIALILVETLLQFAITNMSNLVAQNVVRDIRVKIFGHITKLRLKYFDDNPIGRLVTRVVSDIETISNVFSQGFFSMMNDFVTIIFVLVGMFLMDWQFAIAILIPIPILLWATVLFKRAIKKSFTQVRNEVSNLNTFAQEHITGMKIVQIFGREEEEARRFSAINAKHKEAHIKSVWAFSVFLPAVELLSATSIGLLICWALVRIGDASLSASETIGVMTGMIMFVSKLYRPIRMLADKFNTLQMGVVGGERVFKVLDTDETIVSTGNIDEVDLAGELTLNNVWFAYKDEEYVLKNISLEIKQGQTIAFVGATGAGKTSIINLISRFYEFQKGEILIDGQDIRQFSNNAIRENISVVLQDVFLYSDSILNNITLGNSKISLDEVKAAAKSIGAHEFITKLPGGYEFNAGERGGALSVGQRQLISFIRAYVYNPKILVLDEATSSIDTESEILVQGAIDKLTEGRTSIVIAHRLSTIQNADSIVVLDKGEIVEVGTHSELLKINEGFYRNLYEMQFKD